MPIAQDVAGRAGGWMDVLALARIEVSSEDELFPMTHALRHSPTLGWRAAEPGPQNLRLRFDTPQAVSRVWIHVLDRAAERSQELSLFAGTGETGLREVARWQFTFSPSGSTEEIEDLAVALEGVTVLELRIRPDRAQHAGRAEMYAVLQSFWLA